MPRIDDYRTKLLEEITVLQYNNKKLSERLEIQKQKAYEAMEANCHEYTRGYAQRYVDMQAAGLEEIMRKAEKWDQATIGEGEGYEEYVKRISEAGAFFVRSRIALDKLMAGLMVDEPKKHFYNEDMTECERTEPPATRPAAPEEVREFMEQTLKLFPLKDGAVLRLDFQESEG